MPRCGGCGGATTIGGGGGGGGDWTTGDIKMSGSPDGESGWLLCDGQAVSRTTYAPLFARIGTRYGAGNGSTTFNVPSLNSEYRFPRGSKVSGTVQPGQEGGEETHVLTTGELPAHSHSIRNPNAPSEVIYYDYAGGGALARTILRPNVSDASGASSEWVATDTGGGAAHNNAPPYVGVTFLIKT